MANNIDKIIEEFNLECDKEIKILLKYLNLESDEEVKDFLKNTIDIYYGGFDEVIVKILGGKIYSVFSSGSIMSLLDYNTEEKKDEIRDYLNRFDGNLKYYFDFDSFLDDDSGLTDPYMIGDTCTHMEDYDSYVVTSYLYLSY